MKLIKLSKEHYVIVDESEINDDHEGWFTTNKTKLYFHKSSHDKIARHSDEKILKITHSFGKHLDRVENRLLSEVEEAIYGYSVEKMVGKHVHNRWKNADNQNAFNSTSCEKDYIAGFKAHQELVKDKLFTNIKSLFDSYGDNYPAKIIWNDLKEILEPTEWEVEFDEQGKLKLI